MQRINNETTEPVYGNHMVSPSSSTDMTDQSCLSNTGESAPEIEKLAITIQKSRQNTKVS